MQRAWLWDIWALELLSQLKSVSNGYTEQELHRGPWFFMNNVPNSTAVFTNSFLLSLPQCLCEDMSEVWGVFFFFLSSPAAGTFSWTLTLEMVTVTCQEPRTQRLVTEILNTPKGYLHFTERVRTTEENVPPWATQSVGARQLLKV